MFATDIFKSGDYRAILKREFEVRKARRPSYSLRAFARDLNLKSATLSGVLNNRHGLSGELARQIATRLGFNEDQSSIFFDMVESQHARTKIARAQALKRVQARFKSVRFEGLRDQEVDILKDWRFPAVLELVSLRPSFTPAQISRALGITLNSAEKALRALLGAGVLAESPFGFHRDKNYLFASSPTPSQTIRNFHRQILALASKGLQQPIESRKFLSTVVQVESSRVAEAKEWLERAHVAFVSEFATSEQSDSVYAFALQFFRLDVGSRT